MSRSRFNHGIQAKRVELTKSDDYTMTVANCRKYGLLTQTGGSKTLTLPAAETKLAGADVLCVDKGGGTFKVFVTAGFSGQGGSYDTVDVPTNGAVLCYCDGSNWHVLGATPTAT